MDSEYLRVKMKEFLESYKDTSQYLPWSSVITRFVEYIETTGKDVKEFDTDDFEGFLKQFSNPNTISQIKGKIQIFMKYCGYDVKDSLPRTGDIVPELNYLLSFNEMKAGIDEVRRKHFEDLGSTPYNPLVCDNFTLGEVIIYLAWIGVPRDTLGALHLSAINLDKKCVEYEEDGVKRVFSFADNPVIADTFGKYSKSKQFVGTRVKNGKMQFLNGDYYGDGIIRLSSPPKDNSSINIKSFLNRIFSRYFPFAGEYKIVYYSGAFSRGYEKITQGNLPSFTPDGIMNYFGVIVETESVRYSFKRQWDNYLAWRQTMEGVNLDPDTIRMAKMRSIAVNNVAALSSFPDDKSAKIETTAGELEALMLAVYNLGKNGL